MDFYYCNCCRCRLSFLSSSQPPAITNPKISNNGTRQKMNANFLWNNSFNTKYCSTHIVTQKNRKTRGKKIRSTFTFIDNLSVESGYYNYLENREGKKFLALKAFPVFCASVKRDNSCIDHRLVKMTSTASSRGTKKRHYFDWTRCCVSSNRFLGNEIPNIMCRSGMFARCLIYPTDAIRLW